MASSRFTGHPPRAGTVARRVVAGVLVAVGLFVLSIGAGVPSWPVVAVGAALMLLAVGLVTVVAVRGGERGWMTADAHVITVTPPPSGVRYGRAEMDLVLTGPGLPTLAVTVRDPKVPVDRWPAAGSALPVLVAVDDRRNVRVQWDDVAPLGPPPTDAPAPQAPPVPAPPDVTAPVAAAPPGPVTGTDPTAPRTAGAATPPDRDATAAPPEPAPPRRDRQPGGESADQPLSFLDNPLASTAPGQVAPLLPRPRAGTGSDGPAPVPPRGQPAAADAPAAGITGPLRGVGASLGVRDLDRSLEFYTKVLDFAAVDRGPRTAVVAAGETRLILYCAPHEGQGPRRLVHLNLEVGDIRASHAALRAAGVRFTGAPRAITTGPQLQLWAASFRDPDGHRLAITQWRPAASPQEGAPDPGEIPPHQTEQQTEHAQRDVQ